MTDRLILTLSILGGTGKVGPPLAYRWGKAGYHVNIGSRTPDKAAKVAAEVNQKVGREAVKGISNVEAAADCDIAILTVPYSAHRATLEELREPLQGKLLVDITSPIGPPDRTVVMIPEAGSAAQEAQEILGPGVKVVSALQSVSFVHLREDGPVPCDAFVCGDNPEAKEQVLQLLSAANLTGWDAGPLKNSVVAEGLTPILLGINRYHKVRNPGFRITGHQVSTDD